jgi:hypothetical protein
MPQHHDVHVSQDRVRGDWQTTHGSRTIARLPTQAAAFAIAEREARYHGVALVVHGRDGRIESTDHYGNSPGSSRVTGTH